MKSPVHAVCCLALWWSSFVLASKPMVNHQEDLGALGLLDLSEKFDVSRDSLLALKNHTRSGLGELSNALGLSKKFALHVDDLFKIKNDKEMDWEELETYLTGKKNENNIPKVQLRIKAEKRMEIKQRY